MAAVIRKYVRLVMIWLRRIYLVSIYGMDIAQSARISWGVKLDKTYPKGIHVGDESYLASGSLVLTHDFCRGVRRDTYIGRRCFIGADAIILPGVRIGDSVVIGAGAVVTRDVPSGCIVAGNPARILRQGVKTECFGQILEMGQRYLPPGPVKIDDHVGILGISNDRDLDRRRVSRRNYSADKAAVEDQAVGGRAR